MSKTRYIQMQTAMKFWKRIHKHVDFQDQYVQVGERDIDEMVEIEIQEIQYQSRKY